MQTKNILLGLLSLTAIAEASAIDRPFENLVNRRALRSLEARQNRGGRFGNGGGFNNGQNRGGQGGQGGQANQGNQNNQNNQNNQGNQGNQGNTGNNNGGQAAATLNANALQTGSASDGNPDTSTGESASQTDNANFINFCSGKTLTNGAQNTDGSCNGIVMGNIPAKNKMVSSVFVSPQNGQDVTANQDFQIQVQVNNLAAGVFTNAQRTYYTAPQDVDGSGNIIGHVHVTVQDLGNSLNPTSALDASQFAFFKGINDAGNGAGLLSADVTGGLPAGNYRLCSMSAAANHQPVLMPVAQRGAQDDCVRFTVGGNGNGNGNNNQNNGQNNGQNTGQNNGNGQGGRGGRGGQNQGNSNNSTGQDTGNNQADNSQNSSALGGITAPAVTNSGDSSRPFSVNGDTFVNQAAAIQRSCDIQQNQCSNAVNGGQASFSVTDCQTQQQQCISSAGQ